MSEQHGTSTPRFRQGDRIRFVGTRYQIDDRWDNTGEYSAQDLDHRDADDCLIEGHTMLPIDAVDRDAVMIESHADWQRRCR